MALYGFKFEIAEMVFGGASRESGRLAHGHVTEAWGCMKGGDVVSQEREGVVRSLVAGHYVPAL